MAVSFKEIHRWNPDRITSDVLSEVFCRAELISGVSDEEVFFAQGLLQKFKGLMMASLGMHSLSQIQFEVILERPKALLPLEARRWQLRCAQVHQWLEEHALELA